MKPLLSLFFTILLVVSAAAQQSAEALSLTATVTNENGFIKSLTAENFEVYLNNTRGSVDIATQLDEPVSIAIVVDVSSSMENPLSGKREKLSAPLAGFSRFLSKAHPQNEYSIMSFSTDVKIALEPTQNGDEVKKTLMELAGSKLRESETRLYEAVETALAKLKTAKHEKRVLLLISDGEHFGDTKLDFGVLKKLVAKSNVLIYFFRVLLDESRYTTTNFAASLRQIPVVTRDIKALRSEFMTVSAFPRDGFLDSFEIADGLSSATGGRVYFPFDQAEAERSFENLTEELKSQYRLIVTPSAGLKKNRANEIKVKLRDLRAAKKMVLRTRKAIYF